MLTDTHTCFLLGPHAHATAQRLWTPFVTATKVLFFLCGSQNRFSGRISDVVLPRDETSVRTTQHCIAPVVTWVMTWVRHDVEAVAGGAGSTDGRGRLGRRAKGTVG